MSGNTDIPEDVMKAAQAVQDAAMAECKAEKFAVYEYPFGTGRAKDVLDAAIARAILAEREAQRERDAKIADGHKKVRTTLSGPEAGKLIAQSIAFAIRHPA